MPIGEGDDEIFFNTDDFAETFFTEDGGIEFAAIFNDPSGMESVVDAGIDFTKPYLDVSADVALMLMQGDFILRGSVRYQVTARPVSLGSGDYMVPLVIARQ